MRWTFAITALALFMFALDRLIVATALPAIRADLGASLPTLEWTVNAYTLSFTVLILAGAALGDRFGRRRMFVCGVAVFTAGSAAAALAPSATALVAARAVQGAGGAVLTPLSLTILSAAAPPERRGALLGAWGAVAAVAGALAAPLGGALTSALSWQWIFWINVPIGLAVIPLALRRLPESHGTSPRLDVRGIALAGGGLLALVWGLIEAGDAGWGDPVVLAAVALGLLGLAAFTAWERHAPAPMLPPRFFESRAFAAASGASLLAYAGLLGSLFLLGQLMQAGFGASPLEAGVRLLPWTAVVVAVLPVAGRLCDRFGPRPLMAGALAALAGGLGWLAALAAPGTPYTLLVPGLVLGGLGGATFFVPAQTALLAAVRPEEQGQASGAANAVRELGGVLGVGAIAGVFAAHGSASGSPDAFLAGFRPAVAVAAALVAIGALAALAMPRPGRPRVRVGTRRPVLAPAGEVRGPSGVLRLMHDHLSPPPLRPALAVAPGGAVALPWRPPRVPRPDAGAALRRLLKHPRLTPFHRLLAAVLLVNLAVLVQHLARGDWRIEDGSALSALGALTLVNLTAAVLVRQQNVLNVLYGLAGRGSRSWPLWLRWSISKVHHVGGIHAGAALAATAWLVAFACVAVIARVRHPAGVTTTTLVLVGCLVALALVIVACSAPAVRSRAHNVFELSHRFCGWTAIALLWALTVHLALHGRGDASAVEAVASDWHAWVLAVLTMSVASPWLRLRRVPVTVERPSDHAAIVRFDYGVTPAFASAVGISRSPLREWHAFATVATPGETGFRVLISRAGDWTGRFIDDPPSHVWVRGTPVSAPMAKVALLYQRVVYVVTGSGIGPCLGQILAERVPAKLVWSTRSPRATYGDDLVDEVQAAQPDALIWDTSQDGKPDLVALALQACRDFDAEAVFVVSNKPATQRLVHALERRGIPAFGPIWDS